MHNPPCISASRFTGEQAPSAGDRRLFAVMALIVALGTALAIRDGSRLKSLDELAFLDISANVAAHAQYAHTNRPDIAGYDPAVAAGALRLTAYRAPGYVWFQVPFRVAGGEFVALRIANFVLLALTLWGIHALLSRRFPGRAASIAIGLVLGYPVLLYAAGALYPQTLAAALLVWTVRIADGLDGEWRPRRLALLGAVFGALVLTVPILLLVAPILFGWLAWPDPRRRSLGVAFAVAVTVAVIAPWTVRNARVFGTLVPVSTSSGYNLVAGNSPSTRHDQAFTDIRWPRGLKDQVSGRSEVERDRLMTRAALSFVREQPGRAAVLYVRKLLYWFSFRNPIVSDWVLPGGPAAGPGWLRDAVMLVTYGALLLIAGARLLLGRVYPWSRLEILLAALYVGGGMAYAIYFTRIRFRLPFDWLLIVLDAVFLAQVLDSAFVTRSVADPARGD